MLRGKCTFYRRLRCHTPSTPPTTLQDNARAWLPPGQANPIDGWATYDTLSRLLIRHLLPERVLGLEVSGLRLGLIGKLVHEITGGGVEARADDTDHRAPVKVSPVAKGAEGELSAVDAPAHLAAAAHR